MPTKTRERVVVLLFVSLLLVLSSCDRHPPAPQTGPPKVEASQISRLAIGMECEEVLEALKPARALMGSVPALSYSAKEGGTYYLAFQGESDSPAPGQHGLQYVVHFPEKQMGRGTYVLPAEKRGQVFEVPEPDESAR